MHQGNGHLDHRDVAGGEYVPARRHLPIDEAPQQRSHPAASCGPACEPQGHESGHENAEEEQKSARSRGRGTGRGEPGAHVTR